MPATAHTDRTVTGRESAWIKRGVTGEVQPSVRRLAMPKLMYALFELVDAAANELQ